MSDLHRYTQQTIAAGSKSFAKAALLFDKDTRADVLALYAWCRYCDDVIDGQTLGHDAEMLTAVEKQQRLAGLREETARIFAGHDSDLSAFQALQHVIQRHDLPQRHVQALLDGFAMDADEVTFPNLPSVLRYCYHVAGVVGVMMALIMGVQDRATLHSAADLGLGFQLTNIARDIMADAAIGRCYLPQDWLAEAGLSPENFALPENSVALFSVAQRLLDTAEPYYASAQIGMTHLPLRSAWAIAAAAGIYRAIGVKLRRAGPGGLHHRSRTSSAHKMALLLKAGLTAAIMQGRKKTHLSRDRLWSSDQI